MTASLPTTEEMAGRMLRYLQTWTAPNGALHGMHTHPVWRLHPGILEDHYTGYSAWGAPYAMALADLTRATRNAELQGITEQFLRYVVSTQMADGRWDNAGAEFGRRFNSSTVDNMLQDLSLAYAARRLQDVMPTALHREIGERVRRNLDSYLASPEEILRRGHAFTQTTNQDCAGLWALGEWMDAFGSDARYERIIVDVLRQRLERDFVRGVPTPDAGGMLRAPSLPDYIEPAEYYGVIIPPLVWAYRKTGDKAFLDAALMLARHNLRCSWRDARGCARLHRSCDAVRGVWQVSRTPMLIGGGGLYLWILEDLLDLAPDDELREFSRDLQRTLAHHHNRYGFLTQAADWHDDFDIIAGTAWQVHDLAFLARTVRDGSAVVAAWRESAPDVGLIIGWTDLWAENRQQWAIMRPFSFGWGSVGAKTASHGYPSQPKWVNPVHPPMTFQPEIKVRLVNETFYIEAPGCGDLSVTSIYGRAWERLS